MDLYNNIDTYYHDWLRIGLSNQSLWFWKERKMVTRCIDRLIGKYCKIVTREPGEERAHVIFGLVTNIDHDSGLLVIESNQGVGCLNIKTIEAIKPSNKKT